MSLHINRKRGGVKKNVQKKHKNNKKKNSEIGKIIKIEVVTGEFFSSVLRSRGMNMQPYTVTNNASSKSNLLSFLIWIPLMIPTMH